MFKKKILKIAILATVTDFGGAEKVVLSLINRINTDQFDLVPVIFTASSLADNVFFKHLDKAGKQYYKIFVNNRKIKYLNPLSNVIETYKLLRKLKIDLVHTHGYRADVLGIFLSRSMGLPVISTCHGFILNNLHLTLYNKLDRFALRFANKITTVSREIRNDLIRSGVKESRVIIIPNAVDGYSSSKSVNQNRQLKRQLCKLTENDFVVGYVGRLSEEKGIRYLIEAISMLKRSDIPAKLLIIGEGPQRKELENLVEELSLRDRIMFAGFQKDIDKWLSATDVFVLPSLTEGTPMSMLEAMAAGIPVIASAVGGVPQVIDSGKNGILVSPHKTEEIKDAIYKLYRNEVLRDDFAQAARKTIKLKYDVETWINKFEKEYIEISQK